MLKGSVTRVMLVVSGPHRVGRLSERPRPCLFLCGGLFTTSLVFSMAGWVFETLM
jgi:hypothetical protein